MLPECLCFSMKHKQSHSEDSPHILGDSQAVSRGCGLLLRPKGRLSGLRGVGVGALCLLSAHCPQLAWDQGRGRACVARIPDVAQAPTRC